MEIDGVCEAAARPAGSDPWRMTGSTLAQLSGALHELCLIHAVHQLATLPFLVTWERPILPRTGCSSYVFVFLIRNLHLENLFGKWQDMNVILNINPPPQLLPSLIVCLLKT